MPPDAQQNAGMTGLRLVEISGPTLERIRFFQDWEKAYKHVRDHLLSRPERDGWRLVIPEINGLLDLDNEDAVWDYHRRAARTSGSSAQDLYDCYSRAVEADCLDSKTLGWHRTEEQTTIALGTSGVLTVVTNQVVKSARLPGLGIAEMTIESHGIPVDSPRMPRHRPMRSWHRNGKSDERHPKEERRKEERESQWTREQKLFFRVFRMAVQHIMRAYHRSYDLLGERFHGDDAAWLKDTLPRRSRLKFEDWLKLREQCGRKQVIP